MAAAGLAPAPSPCPSTGAASAASAEASPTRTPKVGRCDCRGTAAAGVRRRGPTTGGGRDGSAPERTCRLHTVVRTTGGGRRFVRLQDRRGGTSNDTLEQDGGGGHGHGASRTTYR